MAVDEALLESASRFKRCTLRFYQWEEPTLSLGYFQPLAQRQSHPHSQTCAVVRRSTGGGAILHDMELTYSFTCPIVDRLSAGVEQYYQAFHETLVDVMASKLGLTAVLCETPSQAGDAPFLCFQRRAHGDVMIQPHKIGGSAQRRRQNALLQHGSILVGRSSFAPELPGISELCRRRVQASDLITPWLPAIGARLAINWREGRLDAWEYEMAREIQALRHADAQWIHRR